MSIKETLKKLAAGASVVSMATSFGCGNKKEEVEKEPAPVVETVNPNRQATKEDYKEFCESMVNTDRLVDYDSKTNTCHVIDPIIVKFDDLRFIDKDAEYRKCEDQCAKQNSIPSVEFFDFVVGKCECEITDGMYDNCKIKCADQGSKPVQQRRDFDGNCKCKVPKESASLKQAQGKKLAMVQSMFAIKGM